MIQIKNISFSYHKEKKNQIDDISMELKKDYLTCLIGHNGAGKSTLMKLINGSLIPSAGEISFGEKIILKEGKADFNLLQTFRQKVILVSSDISWPDGQTLRTTVDFLKLLYPAYDEELFLNSLKHMGFPKEKLDNTFGELSTGESMQVKIAFSLAIQPEYLILDEPFANLDTVVKTDMMAEIRQYILDKRLSVLISTHLLDEITDITDYIAVIERGRLTAFGDRESLLTENKIADLNELLKSFKI